MHAFGWSRQQAVDYLRENTVMADVGDRRREIDRYIEMPGQALAYMVGRLEIQRVRAEAEARMGDRFDIRAFHDLVLGSGPVPLSTLDDVVTAWCRVLHDGVLASSRRSRRSGRSRTRPRTAARSPA